MSSGGGVDGVAGDTVLAQVPAAVIAVDLEGRITLWASGAELLYGWTAAEVLGRPMREVLLVEQVPLAQEVAATTHAGGVWEGEMVVRHRDGSSLLIHVRNAPLHDEAGEVVGVIGASMDVAETRRLETRRAAALVRANADAAHAVARLGRLQRLTAALVPSQDSAEVVATICDNVVAAVGAGAAAVTLLEEGGTVLRLAGSSGYTEEQLAGWALTPVVPGLPNVDVALTGTPLLFGDAAAFAAAYPGLAKPDAPFSARACLPVMADDRVLGVLAMSFDGPHDFADEERELLLTIARMCGQALERSRLFTAERRARERDAFTASATALLASSLDIEATLQHLAGLLVPQLADYVVVHLLTDDGRVELAAAMHRDPGMTAWIREQAATTPLDLTAETGMAEVLRTGRAIHHPEVPEEVRSRLVRTTGDPDVAAQLMPRSGIGVAMTAAGVVVGSLALVRTSGDAYSADDLALVQEVADRAGVAVSHARAYERERRAALTLQRSLLPQNLPDLPGLHYAWRYLPGAEGVHVGGDWYDVVHLDHGRVALLIGDVMGRGLRAAAVMGQLRATARAHVTTSSSPAAVLRELDLAVGRLEQGSITTALVGVLDPATGDLVYASAGHLPPLLVPAAGGRTDFLPVDPGPPLGAGAESWPESSVVLSAGDTLLLFTDGLVEDRTRSVTDGMELLRSAVSGPVDPQAACDAALAGTGRDAGHDDDTALLAVTMASTAETAPHFLSTTVSGPTAARAARAQVRERLVEWGVAADVRDDVLVVLTELVVNAVLHAGGEVRVTLRRGASQLRLEVRDSAPDLAPLPSLTALTRVEGRADDEELDAVITAMGQQGMTGRGMTLVAALTIEWGSSRDATGTGKSVWGVFDLDGSSAVGAAPADHEAADGEVMAALRSLPVRLVLAGAAHLDDLERELATGEHSADAQRLHAVGTALLARTARLREPFRTAAREALGRGQRLVDVQAPVSAASMAALDELMGLLDLVSTLSGRGDLLTPLPSKEVEAFREWWVGEVRSQLGGAAPTTCPFPALPDLSPGA